MAIFHLNISTAKNGASAKQQYIERQGRYKNEGTDHDFVASGSMNLPAWAKDSEDFWKEDEQRETGNQYREIRIALPNELTHTEQKEIVETFCKENLAGHALTWAIHENDGRISGEKNPHVHIIFCERKRDPDREEPTRNEYFKRPKRGKDGTIHGGYAKDREITGGTRRKWLENIRQNAEKIINKGLERAGRKERVSCKSLEDQGIDRIPQVHLGRESIGKAERGIHDRRATEWMRRAQENKEIEVTRENIEYCKEKIQKLAQMQRRFDRQRERERDIALELGR